MYEVAMENDLAMISIHVPREGHDGREETPANPYMNISIHVPREGHDKRAVISATAVSNFYPRAP